MKSAWTPHSRDAATISLVELKIGHDVVFCKDILFIVCKSLSYSASASTRQEESSSCHQFY